MRNPCLLLLSVCLAVPAVAQDDPPPDKGGIEFDRSQGGQSTTETAATAAQRLQTRLPSMSWWPAETGENSIRAFLAQGDHEGLIEALGHVLQHGTVRERAAAARALCLLEDRESLPEVEKLFYDPRQRTRWKALLESVAELDREQAFTLAFRFLDSEAGTLRRVAVALLRRNADEEILRRSVELYKETQSDKVRVDIFDLLAQAGAEQLPALALEAVGHRHVPLAAAAADALSWRAEPEVREQLVQWALTDRDRKGPYAWMILAAMERHFREPALPDSLFEELLSYTKSSDLLMAAAACVSSTTIGIRVDLYAEATSAKAVPALLEFVVRGRYFPDFTLCFRYGVAVLEQATGRNFGERVPLWREFWRETNGTGIAVVRELSGVSVEKDAAQAAVHVEKADAYGAWQVQCSIVGENQRSLLYEPGGEVAVVVLSPDMRELLEGMVAKGYFARDLPRELVVVEEGATRIRLAARDQERTVVANPGDPRLEPFETLVEDRLVGFRWQLLLTRGEGFTRRFAEEEAWWSGHPVRADRNKRLLDLGLAELASADPEQSLRNLEILAQIDRIDRFATELHVRRLSQYIGSWRTREARGKLALELLMRTQRPDAVAAAIAALEPKGQEAVEAISQVLVRFEKTDDALADTRPLVRRAALLALSDRIVLPEPQLVMMATEDSDPRVRSEALDLLAGAHSESARAVLLESAVSGDASIRAGAIRALGKMSGEESLQILRTSLESEDLKVVQAACEGLRRHEDPTAGDALEAVLLVEGLGTTRGRLAMFAIKSMPRERARLRLLRLSDANDEKLADEARYGLANLGEVSVVPFLVQQLEDESRHRRTMTLLTYIFCRDFATEPWLYGETYDSKPGFTHSDFLLEALRETDLDTPKVMDLEDQATRLVLVSALEDERWFVRRSALEYLEQATGRTMGGLSVGASPAEIKDMARRWLEAVSGPSTRK